MKSVFRFRVRLQIRNPDFKIQIQIFQYECNNTAEQNIKAEGRTKTLRKGEGKEKKRKRGTKSAQDVVKSRSRYLFVGGKLAVRFNTKSFMNLTGKQIHVQSLQNNKQLLTVFTWSRSGYVINPLQC